MTPKIRCVHKMISTWPECSYFRVGVILPHIFPRMSKNALWLDASDLSNCSVPWKELLYSNTYADDHLGRNKCIVQKSGHHCIIRENSVDFSPLPFSTLYILMGEVAAAANTTFIYFKDLGFVRPAMGSFINYVDKQGVGDYEIGKCMPKKLVENCKFMAQVTS